MSLRILQLCHKPPRPAKDGGCRAMDAVTRGLLAAGHRVRVLSACTDKHPYIAPDPTYQAATRFEAVHIDTRVHARGALAHLLSGESYNVARFHAPELENRLREILQREVFDLVLLESLFTVPYVPLLRKYVDGPVVLRAHNVEHRIWEGLAADTDQITRRLYLKILTDQLARYEVAALNDIDAIVAISQEDADIFAELGCARPIHVTPFGFDARDIPAPDRRLPDHVFHFGAMDWTPNREGVRWLQEQVWPLVRAARPGTELVLAGRDFPADWPLGDGVRVLGEVEDAWSMLNRNGIMAIPLLAGSGVRIKAIEGLATGRPIVSTALGMQGLGMEPGMHYRQADTPDAFAGALIKLLDHPRSALEMGTRGRIAAEAQFENGHLIAGMLAFLETLVP